MHKKILFLVMVLILITGCGEVAEFKESGVSSPENQVFHLSNENNTIGVLIIHGFTASPHEVKELGDYLYEKGFNVYGVRLKGHGTHYDDLKYVKWQDWYDDVEQVYGILREKNNKIYAVGMSTGGALALYLAENEETDGVVSLAAPVYLRDWKSKFFFIEKYFLEYIENNISEEEKPYYYERTPIEAVNQLFKLINEYKKNLNKIEEPLLLIQFLDDPRVHTKSLNYIYDHAGSEKKEIKWIAGSKHVLTTDPSMKEKVFEDVYKFIIEVEKEK